MPDLTTRLADRLEATVRRVGSASESPGRSPGTAVVIGRLLGPMFAICFLTGLYSHVLQEPPGWFPLIAQPFWLYRVTQAAHVIVGLALIPVLLGKLWSVFPRFFTWPPITGIASILERATIALLVSSAVLEVVLGTMNIAKWYPFPFSFRHVHFALAWVAMGSIVLHVAVKLPTIAAYWRARPVSDLAEPEPVPPSAPDVTEPDPAGRLSRGEHLSRRGALTAVAAGAAAITIGTAGQSVDVLAPVSVLAPRRMRFGPQGLPVNRTAREAGVLTTAVDPGWTLRVEGPKGTTEFTLAHLDAMQQVTAALPIACVEGWSQMAVWTGVRMRDLLEVVGAPPESRLRISSLQVHGGYGTSEMQPVYARDPTTLVATRLGGHTLDIDHGYPARIIAPGRPGVLQTKWINRIEVLS